MPLWPITRLKSGCTSTCICGDWSYPVIENIKYLTRQGDLSRAAWPPLVLRREYNLQAGERRLMYLAHTCQARCHLHRTYRPCMSSFLDLCVPDCIGILSVEFPVWMISNDVEFQAHTAS